jgi:hypothetical protein
MLFSKVKDVIYKNKIFLGNIMNENVLQDG